MLEERPGCRGGIGKRLGKLPVPTAAFPNHVAAVVGPESEKGVAGTPKVTIGAAYPQLKNCDPIEERLFLYDHIDAIIDIVAGLAMLNKPGSKL